MVACGELLSIGQIDLLDNPLLREPLRAEHIKPRLLGHWGTAPGLTFTYAHMNRAIRDAEGMRHLFRHFSFPEGVPIHVAPKAPGSIHEGGQPGYSLAHAFGAAFDNPDLLVCCVVGDGEGETGPLAASWHSNKFLDPRRDGAVLPVLHLNGYKIATPTVLARLPREELRDCWRATGPRRASSRATSRMRCTG